MYKITVFGVAVDNVSIEFLMKNINGHHLDRVRYCVTPNVDHFMRLSSNINPDFLRAYQTADLILCDSRVVGFLLEFKRGLSVNVIPGSDLTAKILASNDLDEKNFCVIGSSPESICQLQKLYPLKKISGYYPPFGFIHSNSELKKIIDFISKCSSLDYIFLALGSPQQEILANILKKHFDGNRSFYIFCVGASIDFLVGAQVRAPVLLRNIGMEWLFRLITNPFRLFSRYFNNFLWLAKNLNNI